MEMVFLLSGYATQSNDVETGNNVILPMKQNIREENIEKAVVNNFKSPRPSLRLTRNNEDKSNKNIPDHTSGSGLRCSVENCFNRHSKNLSLFGYPKCFTLRKKWIEKCGIKKYPDNIVKHGTRVCSTYFELERFKNTSLKIRLKPGAVSSLFFDSDLFKSKPNALFYHIVNHPTNLAQLFFLFSEISTDDVDIETIDKDEKLLTYRPDVEAKSIESYRNSKLPRDPETWEDNINKQQWNKLKQTLFEKALSILYSNRLSRLTYEGTVREYVQKIISTEKSVTEMHHLLTNYTHWDISLTQWLHRIFISNLPDDYLASYIDILEKLKQIAPSFVNDMISANSIECSKQEIKSKPINLEEPVDPFNLMLTTYPPLKLPKNPVIILVPDFPGYCTQPNTRTYDWMNALSYLAELDVALTMKVPWSYEEYSREEELDIETSLDTMVDSTRSKVVSVRFEDPNRPIILAGVGVSAAIACQVDIFY
eukprot:XP_016663515.1 PREDICTED: KAT8 regulatory NSL complex subunit 3-like [Acyrthosiphon pisum]